jgi:ribosomal protein L11 methyltransferase
MGSGTGVLAILAEMLGAKQVTAIDYDHWCYENAKENVELNDCKATEVVHGDATILGKNPYDLILANINRNILLQDLSVYAAVLNNGGTILLSGYYKEDLHSIQNKCKEVGLAFDHYREQENWIMARFAKA